MLFSFIKIRNTFKEVNTYIYIIKLGVHFKFSLESYSRELKLVAIVCYIILLKKKQKQKVKRMCWVKRWIHSRFQLGTCSTVTRELQIEDVQQFRCQSPIVKQNMKIREATSVHE